MKPYKTAMIYNDQLFHVKHTFRIPNPHWNGGSVIKNAHCEGYISINSSVKNEKLPKILKNGEK